MHRRAALALICSTLTLAACGFQLRGAYPLPFDSLYIALPETNDLRASLKRSIEAGSGTRVVADPKEAQAILSVTTDAQAKNILSLSSTGRVREFQLVRTFAFRLTDPAGRNFLPHSQVVVTRDISFNDSQVLAKETEEALLWKDIQADLVRQVLRRVSAAKLRSGDEG
ncbi:MAG: hypothetical protein JNK22_10780 [Rhodocyclaceae bacterium]|nr:hypothetical protein [Rhodocyclaceae bacterium]